MLPCSVQEAGLDFQCNIFIKTIVCFVSREWFNTVITFFPTSTHTTKTRTIPYLHHTCWTMLWPFFCFFPRPHSAAKPPTVHTRLWPRTSLQRLPWVTWKDFTTSDRLSLLNDRAVEKGPCVYSMTSNGMCQNSDELSHLIAQKYLRLAAAILTMIGCQGAA